MIHSADPTPRRTCKPHARAQGIAQLCGAHLLSLLVSLASKSSLERSACTGMPDQRPPKHVSVPEQQQKLHGKDKQRNACAHAMHTLRYRPPPRTVSDLQGKETLGLRTPSSSSPDRRLARFKSFLLTARAASGETT